MTTIEREILEVLGDGRAERLGEVVDQFRNGRHISDLMALLDSSHAEVISIGAWILDELPLHLYNTESFIVRLRKLLDHEDPMVRFHAFGALFPALNPQDADAQALVRKLRDDSNEGVRRSAEAAAARLSPLVVFTRVRLVTKKYTKEGVREGAVGYVIEVYADGNYEVEFADTNTGITFAQLVVAHVDVVETPERNPEKNS